MPSVLGCSPLRMLDWLMTVANGHGVGRIRRDSSDLVGIPDSSDVEAEALGRLSSVRVVELFSVLSPDQRDVLTLRIVADLVS